MKAAIYQGNRTFNIEDISSQPLGDDEISIDIAYCGICGTDRHIYHGVMDARVKPPQTIGHEMSGVVHAIGSTVKTIKPGDHVVVRPLDNRGELPSDKGHHHICKNVKFIGIDSPGAMQQRWVVPAFTVHKLPKDIDMKLAALIEPLAVACHDVNRAKLVKGETAVIIGGGPIGLLIGMVAQKMGATVILSEINEYRLSIAKELGFIPINPSKVDFDAEVRKLTDDSGADVVFEVSGAPAGVKAMTQIAAIRGRIVMVAIHGTPQETDLFQFFWKELEMIGARVYEPVDYETAISLVASKELPLQSLITDVVALQDIQKAFEALDNDEKSMKILLDCQN